MVICSIIFFLLVFFFKQKTAYEMRISDWSSDVCSSDLRQCRAPHATELRGFSEAERVAVQDAADQERQTKRMNQIDREVAEFEDCDQQQAQRHVFDEVREIGRAHV